MGPSQHASTTSTSSPMSTRPMAITSPSASVLGDDRDESTLYAPDVPQADRPTSPSPGQGATLAPSRLLCPRVEPGLEDLRLLGSLHTEVHIERGPGPTACPTPSTCTSGSRRASLEIYTSDYYTGDLTRTYRWNVKDPGGETSGVERSSILVQRGEPCWTSMAVTAAHGAPAGLGGHRRCRWAGNPPP